MRRALLEGVEAPAGDVVPRGAYELLILEAVRRVENDLLKAWDGVTWSAGTKAGQNYLSCRDSCVESCFTRPNKGVSFLSAYRNLTLAHIRLVHYIFQSILSLYDVSVDASFVASEMTKT